MRDQHTAAEDELEIARRQSDRLRMWLPLLLSLFSNIVLLGIGYGKFLGRLDSIEFRLGLIEQAFKLVAK
jgi:hypothetical protein